MQTELEAENANLRQLLQATEAASVELARLTMLSGSERMAASREQLGWAAGELNRLNRQLEE